MLYADNHLKIETPQLMNALGHTTSGLMAKIAEKSEPMEFLEYQYQAEWAEPSSISRYPFIVLKAKNNNQLKTLHQSMSAHPDLVHNVFTDSMLGASADEQLKKTLQTKTEELNYFCLVLFGESEEIEPLTRKFLLFKG
ncbi:MAG: DUF2000 family protein [Cyanobacteria bacterium]|jgi:putative lipoic acid-binding regulatory protein|nr:DUF2000 family protein [Cyanobacteria bacterium GSL.Bin21]